MIDKFIHRLFLFTFIFAAIFTRERFYEKSLFMLAEIIL